MLSENNVVLSENNVVLSENNVVMSENNVVMSENNVVLSEKALSRVKHIILGHFWPMLFQYEFSRPSGTDRSGTSVGPLKGKIKITNFIKFINTC